MHCSHLKTKFRPTIGDENRLEAIRHAHVTEGQVARTDRMEDYLEVIFELIEQKGYATTVDISKYLNVSSPSVTKMVQKLDESGHLNYEKYRGIVLTEEGMRVAKSMRERHLLLVEFLKMIGVNDSVANKDAEGIEHHLHPETLRSLEGFVKTMKSAPSSKQT